MRSKQKLMLCLTMLLLTSCQNAQPGNFCYIAKPIYPLKADKISPETGRKILRHDMYGEEFCGWSYD